MEVQMLAHKLLSLGLNPDPAINCHPGVSQTGWFINVSAVPRMDVEAGVPSAHISWWTVKIPWCPLQRVGELSPTPWLNYEFLLEPAEGITSAAQPHPQPMMLPHSLVLNMNKVLSHWQRVCFCGLPTSVPGWLKKMSSCSPISSRIGEGCVLWAQSNEMAAIQMCVDDT